MSPSFDEVFGAEFARLHRYLHRRVGASAAEDLTAAAFATAYAGWHRFEPARSAVSDGGGGTTLASQPTGRHAEIESAAAARV